MTLSATGPRLQFDDIDSAIAALRDRGLRVTIARRVILQALFAAGSTSATSRSDGARTSESSRLPAG